MASDPSSWRDVGNLMSSASSPVIRTGETYAEGMADGDAYNAGSRALQDRFDSRRIADRLEQLTYHDVFNDGDREFIERAPMFFMATADDHGLPTAPTGRRARSCA